MPKLALNCIVKNESGRILRMLESVRPYITAAVIVDTGSTDNTKELIDNWAREHGVKCWIGDAPFENWSQARNAALQLARTYAPVGGYDYLLLVDADMQLVVNNPKVFDALNGPGYDMSQTQGTYKYLNRRIVNVHEKGQYVGVTHEFFDGNACGMIPETDAYFQDYADGANRPSKFKRDIKLLRGGLKTEPNNYRYWFYLAQSYKDAGQLENAIKWYTKRAACKEFDEEAWFAQYQIGHCWLAMGRIPEFIDAMHKAYARRPWRAEPLFILANYYRLQDDMQVLGAMYAERAMEIPFPKNDVLFIDERMHDIGPKEEFAICGYYIDAKKAKAFALTDELALDGRPQSHSAREQARRNMLFFLPALKELCPSARWLPLSVPTDPGYTALNPSITRTSHGLECVVRTVNYRMDDDGRYLINGTDGTANATNPIDTRNVLASLMWPSLGVSATTPLLPPGKLPVEYPLVIGFEDMRLFAHTGKLYTSSTMRQLNKEGHAEQVLTRVHGGTVGDPHRMPRLAEYEKNWMPIIGYGDKPTFMYRLNQMVDCDGQVTKLFDTSLDVMHLSGGTQVVECNGGWIAIVHEALPQHDKPWKRYYWHRVVWWPKDFRAVKVSHPFVFHSKTIEFAAGLAIMGGTAIISYGFEDREARLMQVDVHELASLVWR